MRRGGLQACPARRPPQTAMVQAVVLEWPTDHAGPPARARHRRASTSGLRGRQRVARTAMVVKMGQPRPAGAEQRPRGPRNRGVLRVLVAGDPSPTGERTLPGFVAGCRRRIARQSGAGATRGRSISAGARSSPPDSGPRHRAPGLECQEARDRGRRDVAIAASLLFMAGDPPWPAAEAREVLSMRGNPCPTFPSRPGALPRLCVISF